MRRASMFGTSLLAAAALLLGASGAQAQVAKCEAAKIKCANKKAVALLKCHEKAETKGVALDPLCVDKAEIKFTDPVTLKGCMEKAEAKPPCATTGDAGAIEAKVDAFVLDVVNELDPGYPAVVLNKCSSKKKKCVEKKAAALLKCDEKDVKKPDPVKFATCVQKAMDKFDGGADPTKGCFAKNEAKYPMGSATPCLTFGDTGALEAKVDAFVDDVVSELVPPLSSLLFINGAPGGTCGNIQDGAAAVIKNLTCGGLNLGGGGSIVPEGPTPDGSQSLFALSCAGSNCTISETSTAPGVNTATPDCTDVGCNFGTPLPIPNPVIPNLTTCVLNTFASAASGTLDLGTGVSTTNVDLTSDTYLTGNLGQPCPKCSATGSPGSPGTGTCDRGPRATMACTTTSSTGLTRDCPTGGSSGGNNCGPAMNQPCTCAPGGGFCLDGTHVGPIGVDLSPLTTGSASATQAAGVFCPGQINPGCFNEATCRTITENGTPAGAITPGVPTSATLASVFCIPATGNGLVDASADLPGPGAVSLPGTFEVN